MEMPILLVRTATCPSSSVFIQMLQMFHCKKAGLES